MDTRLKYQEIIKTVLQEHANFRNTIPDGYHSQLCYLVAPGFLCVFMSICKKNTCFWVEDNTQL
jgi:hypothetical protein